MIPGYCWDDEQRIPQLLYKMEQWPALTDVFINASGKCHTLSVLHFIKIKENDDKVLYFIKERITKNWYTRGKVVFVQHI
jgi:hypothetical protein